jgi:outer membrane lipoprotein SlyB
MKMFRKIIILKLVAVFILVTSCATTDPTKVSGDDAQRLLATQFGTVIDVQPVTIRGKKSETAAAIGAVIGGIAGSVADDGRYREVLIATGAVVGGVAGYYLPVKLGEHNGFQYVISIDDKKKPLTLIQGATDKKDEGFKVGQRVTIVFGEKTIRMLPGQV